MGRFSLGRTINGTQVSVDVFEGNEANSPLFSILGRSYICHDTVAEREARPGTRIHSDGSDAGNPLDMTIPRKKKAVFLLLDASTLSTCYYNAE